MIEEGPTFDTVTTTDTGDVEIKTITAAKEAPSVRVWSDAPKPPVPDGALDELIAAYKSQPGVVPELINGATVGEVKTSLATSKAAYEQAQATFSDVGHGDWFYAAVETAFQRGIIAGYTDGTFRPYNNVTRGQLSKLIALARAWPLLNPDIAHFSDAQRGSAFYPFIETAYAHAVLSGYGDGTFRPQLEATRGQLSKMLYIALTQ